MRNKRAPIVLGVIAGILFLYALHAGTIARREFEQQADVVYAYANTALRARIWADEHGGIWPSPSKFSAPEKLLPPAYTIAGTLKIPSEVAIDQVLVDSLGRHRILPLRTVATAGDAFYLGYAVTSEKELLALVEAHRNGVALEGEIPVGEGNGTNGSATLIPLREKLGEYLVAQGILKPEDADLLARIPMFIGKPDGNGAWVLYYDMHAAYVPYPGPFPMTEKAIQALSDAHGRP